MRPRCLPLLLVMVLGMCQPAMAGPREARVPLRDGVLHTDDLLELLTDRLGVWSFDCPIDGRIRLSGLRGSLFLRALDHSLGDGFDLHVTAEALVVRFDSSELPRSIDQTKAVARRFTTVAAPHATADQQALYGLLLPPDLHPAKPVVVLIHGLDSSKGNWATIAKLLQSEGHQVAWFTFPSDQPLADSAELLSMHLGAVAEVYPTMPVHLLTYSMGSLVARGAIEAPDFGGRVDRLIMIAPPNHGSAWARYRLLLEAHEHYHLARNHDQWRWTWMITDGLGEAGRDLKPGSDFIDRINEYGRREGVAYTIIAGHQHPLRRITAGAIAAPLKWTPRATHPWWGVRQPRRWLKGWSDRIANKPGRSDGPVKLDSARLDGVADFVAVAADHNGLYQSAAGEPPPAWPIIRDRLAE